jgi:hypothetical protein
MRPWPVSTASMLFCSGSVMAGLAPRGAQPLPPMEPGPPSVENFHIRAGPSPTTPSRQPTTSTPYAVPLTTMFIPPESCNQNHLTMLSSPGYQIWYNEPVPAPGITVSDCYPSEFLQYYTTYHVNPTTVGSMVPLMSPLVCPFNWEVVSKVDDYHACCPVYVHDMTSCILIKLSHPVRKCPRAR